MFMKYFIFAILLLISSLSFAGFSSGFAAGIAGGMIASSIRNSNDCDTDCQIRFRICDIRNSNEEKIKCYQRIKHHNDMMLRNTWIIFIVVTLIVLVIMMAIMVAMS